MNFQERIYCGQLKASDEGRTVRLAGWVDALRDHGEVLFIHLRDITGVVQVVFTPESSPQTVCARAAGLRNEFCIMVSGRVLKRIAGTENPGIATGEIEIAAEDLTVFNTSPTLPFQISEKSMVAGTPEKQEETVSEEIRLQYRYLDLRRPKMQDLIIKRHRIIKEIRDFLDNQGFIEIETPMLTKSTPEGARDYLVPSRHYPKCFYALPQSPQLFKQMLMVAGMERYFQIVRCFRDEDLRPNRQPEFTQLDIEASFIDEDFIYNLLEELITRIFMIGGINLTSPFPRLTWTQAMNTAGSDRPDLRFGMTFKEVTDIFTQTEYSIFKQIIQQNGCIKGINVKGQSDKLSKNILQNEYAKRIVPGFGAKGMTWMRVLDQGLESNIVQFFNSREREEIIRRFDAQSGDVILMIADPSWSLVCSSLGQLRLHLAQRLELIPPNTFYPLWVTEFPLFEAADSGITSSHHPFTMPHRTDFDPDNIQELLALRSRSYDLVMNGEELGGGSIRINDQHLQHRIFSALGLSSESADEKFGFFLKALEFGAPPHGGLALGIDRVIAMILGAPSIREVIAFPKNRSAFCPLTQAPSTASLEQLAELSLLDLSPSDLQHIPSVDEESHNIIDQLSWVSRIHIRPNERTSIETAVEEAHKLADIVKQHQTDDEPMFTVAPAANYTREGRQSKISQLTLNQETFNNAPLEKNGYFQVPAVLE